MSTDWSDVCKLATTPWLRSQEAACPVSLLVVGTAGRRSQSGGDGSGEREREPRIKKDKGLALPQKKKIITTAYTWVKVTHDTKGSLTKAIILFSVKEQNCFF